MHAKSAGEFRLTLDLAIAQGSLHPPYLPLSRD